MIYPISWNEELGSEEQRAAASFSQNGLGLVTSVDEEHHGTTTEDA